ncbi:MAG: DegT/DnrJ/EryC1/StrS family aminotransferase [Lentisphaerae bacterium]|jgi:perosamine synthetase|nr:DegT/DnrJ/EryC1/StrS family aminotransferase [Lentisphaerota bacterium]MBT4818166.1 DegT/DnrJ/EryC1/StrS family aminotransferase [Lentisphaerota bacterium]MBT5606648.1 DegT/DnrJ/EryC1/StrS family aminotransferase [Lentisphaerota bacterium]MBT7059090.1 DegT/DnrJ/EryC1/StrS family aminotransferase [Lentisphaerota bacterium]MBT7842625.1 DegT/DnrJ/EryC1/StrS family aminotransferase [Lentisphaerota bacterium]
MDFGKLACSGGTPVLMEPIRDGWHQITDLEKQAVMDLMDHGVLSVSKGGIVGEFEEECAQFIGTRFGLACCNGTSTLHSAYVAVGVGPGTEVIVPAYTWHATVTPILHCSATPVFAEIDPATLCLDPADVERRITERTRAITVVQVWGNVPDMDRFRDLADRHGLALIEDASHAHGATWQGKRIGSFGDIGCFSMQGGKAVSGGELGMVVTDSAELFDRMLLLGHFGRIDEGQAGPTFPGIGDMSLGAKYRAHPYAIAVARCGLSRLAELNRLRTRNYAILNDVLRGVKGIQTVDPIPGAERAGYLEFKFLVQPELLGGTRDEFAQACQAENAPVNVDRYSDLNFTYGLLHLAPLYNGFDRGDMGGCFHDPERPELRNGLGYKQGDLPVTEDICSRMIGTPAFADVPEDTVERVGLAMRKVAHHMNQGKK